MSVDASIKIRYSASKNISIILLLEGWSFNDNNGISYLPLGETEGFDWMIQEKILPETVMQILAEKEKLNEPMGIVMTWENTAIGGSFMFRRPEELSILLNVNRKIISDKNKTNITDASWYLSRLIPALEKNDIYIIYFAFEQLT